MRGLEKALQALEIRAQRGARAGGGKRPQKRKVRTAWVRCSTSGPRGAGVGRIAMIQDPTGATIGIMTAKPM
jgi:hypothetical protein